MQRERRRGFIRHFITMGILCVALGWGGTAHAEGPVMALADLGQGTYKLEGHIMTQAEPYAVWKVLTDYENISTFVSSLRKSEVKGSTTERILLEQEALGKKFFISRRVRVLLQVAEMPYKRIEFEDTLKEDFDFYRGSWEIESGTGGNHIFYRLHCKRRFVVPNFIAKDALRKSAEELLKDVEREILRRHPGGKS